MSASPQKDKYVETEDELKRLKLKEMSDDFTIKRVLRYSILAVTIIILFTLTLVFLLELIFSVDFRKEVLDIIKNNISIIVVSGLSILGIYKAMQKS